MNKDNLVGFFTRIPKFFGRGVNIGRVITLSALSLIFLVFLSKIHFFYNVQKSLLKMIFAGDKTMD